MSIRPGFRPRRPVLPLAVSPSPRPAAIATVRHVTPFDYDECAAVELACFGVAGDPFGLRPYIARPGSTVGVVAVLGRRVVGYLFYRAGPGGWRLCSLAVDPAYRRATVGYRLVAWLRGRLSPSRSYIRADVSEDNLPALLFLQAQGFLATRQSEDGGRFVGEDGRIRMGFFPEVAAMDTGCEREKGGS